MATPRETLKYYFRKHALPTEQQFAELIDAFVHVDEDTITQEKIDGLINALADKVSSETFESFKTEIQETVTNNGGDLSALTARVTAAEGNITTLRDDVDTNADNISGLNQRVDALEERPQITVDSTLDGESTNPVENKAVTEALGRKADSADVTALSERVSTLENAEPPTITGNFLKQIKDLDSYEGSEGEIVQYIGATNDKYRRCFFYERKAGETVQGLTITRCTSNYTYEGKNLVPKGVKNGYVANEETNLYLILSETLEDSILHKQDVFGRYTYFKITKTSPHPTVENGINIYGQLNGTGQEQWIATVVPGTYPIYTDLDTGHDVYLLGPSNDYYMLYDNGTVINGIEGTAVEVGAPASWQVIPSSPVVN